MTKKTVHWSDASILINDESKEQLVDTCKYTYMYLHRQTCRHQVKRRGGEYMDGYIFR